MWKEIPRWWIEHISFWSLFISWWAFACFLPRFYTHLVGNWQKSGRFAELSFPLSTLTLATFPFLFFFFYKLIMDGFMKSYDCQDDGTKRLDFMMHVTPSLSGALNYLAPLQEAAQSWLLSSA